MVALLAKHRDKLGDDKFKQLVDEITNVRFEYLQKHEALPKVRPGTLDGYVLEQRTLGREEAMKWVLIKQKYGI